MSLFDEINKKQDARKTEESKGLVFENYPSKTESLEVVTENHKDKSLFNRVTKDNLDKSPRFFEIIVGIVALPLGVLVFIGSLGVFLAKHEEEFLSFGEFLVGIVMVYIGYMLIKWGFNLIKGEKIGKNILISTPILIVGGFIFLGGTALYVSEKNAIDAIECFLVAVSAFGLAYFRLN